MEWTGSRSFRIERTCEQTGCAEWARERGKRGMSRLGGEGLHEMNSLGKFLMPGDGYMELSKRWLVGYMSLQDIWAGHKNPGVQRPDETTLWESKEKKTSTAQALRHSNCRNCRKEEKPVKQRRHRWGGRKEATTQEM